MIKAPFDMVIVRLIHKEVSSTIIIPDTLAKRFKAFHGEVIDIGRDYPNKELKKGDKILFPRHEGFEIEYNGEQFYALKERWVMAVLTEDDL